MKIIGLTGPTGAGKTTVLHAWAELGAVILDCDAIYHVLTQICTPMLDELRERFGSTIFDADGGLRRKVLGGLVFDDPQALLDLNAITHRYIHQEVVRQLEEAREAGKEVAVLDAIALMESGLGEMCHTTVAVVAPQLVRIRRIMARDGITEEYARQRIDAQKGSYYFSTLCDYTLTNEGDDPEQVCGQARELLAEILEK